MTIQFKDVNVIYNRKSPFEYQALKDINTTFESGKFYGLIGHTGSGKSTLIQTMNGLILRARVWWKQTVLNCQKK